MMSQIQNIIVIISAIGISVFLLLLLLGVVRLKRPGLIMTS
jgi:hypothetical protein